jgi:hypothetical protein
MCREYIQKITKNILSYSRFYIWFSKHYCNPDNYYIHKKKHSLSSLVTLLSLTSLRLAPQRHSISTSECSSNTKSGKHKDTAPLFPTTQTAGKKKKKKTPKSNQTKQRIKGEAATKCGREGLVGCRRLYWLVLGFGLSLYHALISLYRPSPVKKRNRRNGIEFLAFCLMERESDVQKGKWGKRRWKEEENGGNVHKSFLLQERRRKMKGREKVCLIN